MTLDKMGHLRPWADDAHVAQKDIEELRQFVKIQLAEEGSDTCASGIVGRCPAPLWLPWGQCLHRAELEHAKDPAIQSDAVLREQDRSRTFPLDCNCDQKHQGPGQQ